MTKFISLYCLINEPIDVIKINIYGKAKDYKRRTLRISNINLVKNKTKQNRTKRKTSLRFKTKPFKVPFSPRAGETWI